MSHSSSDNQEMLENAVFQQLFLGGQRIMGKNPEDSMQLTGVKALLDHFINDLHENLNLIRNSQIEKFIKTYEAVFDIDLSATYERIMANFKGMGGLDQFKGQDQVVIYLVLTKVIEALREHAYQLWGRKRIKEIYQETYEKQWNEEAERKIQHLAAKNEENISLLYNMSFIMLLARVYGSKQFRITLKRLTTMRVNRMMEKIAKS